VHISEIDRTTVRSVEDYLHVNDAVQAKVVAIKEDGKIDLSIKALQEPAAQRPPPPGRRPGVRAEAEALHAPVRRAAGGLPAGTEKKRK